MISAIALLPLCFAAAAPALPPPKNPVELLAKGKGCFVHVAPRVLPIPDRQKPPEGHWAVEEYSPTYLAILHTSTLTGEMRTLFASGIDSYVSPPMNINRSTHTLTLITGIATDAERLCVLLWKSEPVEVLIGEGDQKPKFSKGAYLLNVYRLADGKKLDEVELKEGDFPEGGPLESREKGPLTLRDNVLKFYGVTVEFEGEKIVKQSYEKNPAPAKPRP